MAEKSSHQWRAGVKVQIQPYTALSTSAYDYAAKGTEHTIAMPRSCYIRALNCLVTNTSFEPLV